MRKSKKFTVISAVIIVLAAIFLFVLRVVTPEDEWICDHGVWVEHGNPSSAMPQDPCQ